MNLHELDALPLRRKENLRVIIDIRNNLNAAAAEETREELLRLEREQKARR